MAAIKVNQQVVSVELSLSEPEPRGLSQILCNYTMDGRAAVNCADLADSLREAIDDALPEQPF